MRNKTQSTKRLRFNYIDVYKGILILFVILDHTAHTIAFNGIDISSLMSHFGNWALPFMCFFMPAFFIVTGYCSNWKKSGKTFLVSQFKTIVVPYLFFQITWCVAMNYLSGGNYYWRDVLEAPYTSYWFLTALLFSKVVVYLLYNQITSQKNLIIITSVIALLGIVSAKYNIIPGNILFLNHALIATLFVAIGTYFKENPQKFEFCKKYSYTVFPWFYLFSLMFKRDIPYLTASINIPLQYIPSFIILSVTGSLSLLALSKIIAKNRILEYLGRNSLIIYCTHFYIMIVVMRCIWEGLQPNGNIGYAAFFLGSIVCTAIACSIVSYIFQFKPFCWLLGKNN